MFDWLSNCYCLCKKCKQRHNKEIVVVYIKLWSVTHKTVWIIKNYYTVKKDPSRLSKLNVQWTLHLLAITTKCATWLPTNKCLQFLILRDSYPSKYTLYWRNGNLATEEDYSRLHKQPLSLLSQTLRQGSHI